MSSRRIPDPGSLIAGITFAGIGLIFLVGNVELAERARWVWPIVLVGLGAGLLAAVLRRVAEPDAEGPVAGATPTFEPTGPFTPAPSDEPAAAAALPYEPPGEPAALPYEPSGEPAALPYEPSGEPDAGPARFPRDEDGPPEGGAAAEAGVVEEPDVAEDTEVEPGLTQDVPADEGPRGRPGS
jgi:hypothetical protein